MAGIVVSRNGRRLSSITNTSTESFAKSASQSFDTCHETVCSTFAATPSPIFASVPSTKVVTGSAFAKLRTPSLYARMRTFTLSFVLVTLYLMSIIVGSLARIAFEITLPPKATHSPLTFLANFTFPFIYGAHWILYSSGTHTSFASSNRDAFIPLGGNPSKIICFGLPHFGVISRFSTTSTDAGILTVKLVQSIKTSLPNVFTVGGNTTSPRL